jgi:hypothetical protein
LLPFQLLLHTVVVLSFSLSCILGAVGIATLYHLYAVHLQLEELEKKKVFRLKEITA